MLEEEEEEEGGVNRGTITLHVPSHRQSQGKKEDGKEDNSMVIMIIVIDCPFPLSVVCCGFDYIIMHVIMAESSSNN